MTSKEQPENQNLTVTSVEEIKRRARQTIHEGKVIELPSGISVRLARPSLTLLMRDGAIPSNLVQTAIRQIEGKGPVDANQVRDSIKVVELIITQAVKEPKVVLENPSEGELEIADFSDEDKGFIFSYVQSGATELAPFRSK